MANSLLDVDPDVKAFLNATRVPDSMANVLEPQAAATPMFFGSTNWAQNRAIFPPNNGEIMQNTACGPLPGLGNHAAVLPNGIAMNGVEPPSFDFVPGQNRDAAISENSAPLWAMQNNTCPPFPSASYAQQRAGPRFEAPRDQVLLARTLARLPPSRMPASQSSSPDTIFSTRMASSSGRSEANLASPVIQENLAPRAKRMRHDTEPVMPRDKLDPSQWPVMQHANIKQKHASMELAAEKPVGKARPFPCMYCSKAFTRKHDLERHARVHSGDKPYACTQCQKAFPRSDALRRHMRVDHDTVVPYWRGPSPEVRPALPFSSTPAQT
ncbi:hypothetical protein MVES_001043 [Malassezia vespertilionis]|uniref:C2H2-type domain-containing protein n=1 Tax=Malassezia vespertilionis TaxID=2020962 RepID=A0A2N1JEB6_9BASI|nr:hypothetical protein MVES_001043 [Malassezia vespertilionis]